MLLFRVKRFFYAGISGFTHKYQQHKSNGEKRTGLFAIIDIANEPELNANFQIFNVWIFVKVSGFFPKPCFLPGFQFPILLFIWLDYGRFFNLDIFIFLYNYKCIYLFKTAPLQAEKIKVHSLFCVSI